VFPRNKQAQKHNSQFKKQKQKPTNQFLGWECSSVIEHLPSMCEAKDFLPKTCTHNQLFCFIGSIYLADVHKAQQYLDLFFKNHCFLVQEQKELF
jgi:hypothetical protein